MLFLTRYNYFVITPYNIKKIYRSLLPNLHKHRVRQDPLVILCGFSSVELSHVAVQSLS